MTETYIVDGIDVQVQGSGAQTLLMLHGWPDSYRLWENTVVGLQSDFRCVRFSLPGFDIDKPARAVSLAQMTTLIAAIVEHVSPGKAVTLLAHDWGCVFGYEFAAQHPEKVVRMVAVDIGDHNTGNFIRSLTTKAKLQMAAYQLPLALAWYIGQHLSGRMGDWLTRQVARGVRCPSPPAHIGWKQNYPYAMVWLGLAGGFKRLLRVKPTCPLLFIYGERKPFMFHSPQWLTQLSSTPGCKVQGFPTGHWVMLEQPQSFVGCIRAWLPRN